jgi:phospholipid/cholesterol/gamma-HCH transport system permease protein
MEPAENSKKIDIISQGETRCRIVLGGAWRIRDGLPLVDDVLDRLGPGSIDTVILEGGAIEAWDSSLLGFLLKLTQQLGAEGIRVDLSSLPDGAQGLLALATAVPEREGARRDKRRQPLLERFGTRALAVLAAARDMVHFLGEASLAFLRLARGKVRFRRADFARAVHDCGPGALPIVSLISVLVGLILAFVGAIQLQMFGAEIYVADLVGLGMAREMGAMMSAVIMAGRTGAAFAAELGTMEVNEEIDALTTLGISPMEFLVLPRLLALMLMMPLLCLYANLMGIAGGAIVGVTVLDINPAAYFLETREAVPLVHFSVGLIKSVVFGVIVALSGCLRGMQCGRSSSAVGAAATSAVVTAIVFIIVSDAMLTVIFDMIGM